MTCVRGNPQVFAQTKIFLACDAGRKSLEGYKLINLLKVPPTMRISISLCTERLPILVTENLLIVSDRF